VTALQRGARLGVMLALAAMGCAAETGAPRDAGAQPDSRTDAAMAVDSGAFDAAAMDAAMGDAAPDPELPDPLRVGGALTAMTPVSAPFLTPAPGLDVGTQPAFSVGRELFVADWEPAPGSRTLIDGLGPLLHATSCLACHPAAGRARSLEPDGSVASGLLFRLAHEQDGGWAPDPVLGGQLQPLAVADVPSEGVVRWSPAAPPDARYQAVSATSPMPSFEVDVSDAYPAPDPALRAGARLAPHLTGVGLLERVLDEAILAWEDVEDRDQDGISGRASRITTPGESAIGRFGWKASQPRLRAQSAAAFANDMGITSPDVPADDCTAAQSACLDAPSGGAPEITGEHLDAVVVFMSHLAVPAARRDNGDPPVIHGAALFEAAGCSACHRATLVTGLAPGQPLLSEQTFHPYTDLLLHDMGSALADSIAEGDATPAEWRTAPLWGLGLVAQDPGARFLHDGRARTLEDAILWHGGEAEAARAAFAAMSRAERDALLTFLRSL
jgi:CxxC motif-containing protein (DUF1111 family)